MIHDLLIGLYVAVDICGHNMAVSVCSKGLNVLQCCHTIMQRNRHQNDIQNHKCIHAQGKPHVVLFNNADPKSRA